MRSYLSSWPGKSAHDDGVEQPAVYHMLDVAAVAEVLIAPLRLSPPLRDALVLLIGLHDLGKVGESFRRMIRGFRRDGCSHWELSEAWLCLDAGLCERLGADRTVWEVLVAAVAGHHGRPSIQDQRYFKRLVQREGAEAARDVALILADMVALWPDASLAGVTEDEARRLSWRLAGLTSASDWVASNPDWFAPCPPGPLLEDYLQTTRRRAVDAVRAAGLAGAAARPDLRFDFTPRPMQMAARDIVLPAGPTLAIVEDETGSGKTEAALILAHRMLAAGKGRGLYLALPTTATADAMFSRACRVVGRMLAEPSVTLAHGRAHLSEEFRDLVGREAQSDDVVCASWLADNRRRALLADVGVGTIDQALLAVMPTRFSTLRMWGLASKILIVDEAHEVSGDSYMRALLAELLRVHAAQGGSAVLLTATLPLRERAALSRAFAEGAGHSWAADPDPAYPSLSIVGGAARRDFPQGVSAKGPVRVERLAAADAAVELLAEAAAKGAACVWVRNAVDDAIAALEALKARDVDASLLHARFALADRKRVEAAELKRFGRSGQGRAGKVLVATQVVESSLDLDFDVMVSDLAPIGALIQRFGRLWRHMDLRPRETRPAPSPVLYVLSPDPADVKDDRWLRQVLDGGAWVYPLADQWRAADVLFRAGAVEAPGGVRNLIEAACDEARPPPAPLEAAEQERLGEGYARANRGEQNVVAFEKGYRDGGAGADDVAYPTRLGRETRTLVLARREGGRLVPWAGLGSGDPAEAWMLSEVQADARRLSRLELPDQDAPEIEVMQKGWPDWRRKTVVVCPVGEDGVICEGLTYDRERGLLWR